MNKFVKVHVKSRKSFVPDNWEQQQEFRNSKYRDVKEEDIIINTDYIRTIEPLQFSSETYYGEIKIKSYILYLNGPSSGYDFIIDPEEYNKICKILEDNNIEYL